MKVYVDGSAHPNPGPGGFGVVVVDDSEEYVYNIYSKSCDNTTNNREELKAILWAAYHCSSLIGNRLNTVYSDSAYAINTLNNWMYNWESRGWLKGDGGVPENLDLIKAYFDWEEKGHFIKLEKVRGHNGVYYNELAD